MKNINARNSRFKKFGQSISRKANNPSKGNVLQFSDLIAMNGSLKDGDIEGNNAETRRSELLLRKIEEDLKRVKLKRQML
jgi:hypothetical protein